MVAGAHVVCLGHAMLYHGFDVPENDRVMVVTLLLSCLAV